MSELRYVVLRHDGIEVPHFDLMFEREAGSDLITFRFPDWPIWEVTEVTELRPHRRAYLSYEGNISGGRGNVQRIAEGTCRVEHTGDGTWRVTLLSDHPTVVVLTSSQGSAYFARIEGNAG
jgi:hypothetical protein